MKKLAIVLFVLFAVQGQVIYAQDWSKATDYLSFISKKQKTINESVWEYLKSASHSKDKVQINQKKKNLVASIRNARESIAAMPPFQGNNTLRDSVLAFLDFSEMILKKQYAQVEKLEFESQKSYKAMKKLLEREEQVMSRYEKRGDRLYKMLQEFAGNHDIRLVEKQTELKQKLEKTNKVNTYYNKVFLVEFRNNIAKNFAIKAINEQDTSALKQWTDSIAYAVKNGRKRLQRIGAFQGDHSLIKTCRKNLKQAEIMRKKYMDKPIAMFRVKDRVEKLEKKLKSTPEKERNQKQVDHYNNMVNRYNKLLKQYNKAIDKMNALHKKSKKRWENTAHAFRDKHVPE